MNTIKLLAGSNTSQWKDVKVSGGSKTELTKAVAQIRSRVNDERKIFSTSTSIFGTKDKPVK